MSRESNYFRGVNTMATDRKEISTSSIFGTISSILTGGKKANIKSTSQSESREVDIAMPYGFASFGFNGMKAHMLITGKQKSIVGIIDSKRPKTKDGEVIIYTRDGTQIRLCNNGNISIECDKSVTINGEDPMKKIESLENQIEQMDDRIRLLESRL